MFHLPSAFNSSPTLRRKQLLQRVLIPNHIFALLSGDEGIEIAVGVHVHKANVVGGLVVVDNVGGELAFAVILKPSGLSAHVGAGDGVDVPIAVDVAHLQAV